MLGASIHKCIKCAESNTVKDQLLFNFSVHDNQKRTRETTLDCKYNLEDVKRNLKAARLISYDLSHILMRVKSTH